MHYNFDEIINRHGTDSVKWDAVENRWGRNDLIPMWVADMDFRTAPFVIEALKKRLALGGQGPAGEDIQPQQRCGFAGV